MRDPLQPVAFFASLAAESCLQVLLNVSYYGLLLHEVAGVPLLVGGGLRLLELAPVL
jgi:hypothetical protein